MKIIVAICFLFSVLGRMFSWNRHGQEKSHGAAFLSRRSSKPCAKRLSAWKGCSEEEIHRCVWLSNLFAFHSRVFRFRTCAERRAELGRLSVGILVLSCVQRGAWVVRSFGDRSSLVAQHKNVPASLSCRRRNTIKIRKKHIESFWRGIPLFAAVAALSALIVTAF